MLLHSLAVECRHSTAAIAGCYNVTTIIH